MELCLDNTDCHLVMVLKTALQSDVRIPFDDDLDFFRPEDDILYEDMTSSNIKKLISPYQEDAFSEDVLHEVANQSLGFFLPHEMWSYIERAFAYYWDEEVGLNGVTCDDYMFLSIRQQLINKKVLFSDELLSKVVTGIYDFMMEIPGVILDY